VLDDTAQEGKREEDSKQSFSEQVEMADGSQTKQRLQLHVRSERKEEKECNCQP